VCGVYVCMYVRTYACMYILRIYVDIYMQELQNILNRKIVKRILQI